MLGYDARMWAGLLPASLVLLVLVQHVRHLITNHSAGEQPGDSLSGLVRR
jgi:hypothetical protein